MAFSAVTSSTAATARMGSPTNRGSFVRMGGLGGSTGVTSSGIRMPTTPSIFSASEASMLRTLACGSGLVSRRQKTMPSARKSSANFAWPVTFATTSCGVKFFPMSS